MNDITLAEAQKNARQLQNYLLQGQGAMVGEAAVVSTKVHMSNPSNPNLVAIIENADAGQVFYHRRQAHQIVHIDVFHNLAELPHRYVAAQLKKAVITYTFHLMADSAWGAPLPNEAVALGDLVDVQTASGGGRISGRLQYGKKRSLREAHLTHCHVTAKLTPKHYALVFYLVDAIEESVEKKGLQLRKIVNLVHETAENHQHPSSTPYADVTDSLLNQGRRVPDCSEEGAAHHYRAVINQVLDSLRDLDTLQKQLDQGRGYWDIRQVDKGFKELLLRLSTWDMVIKEGSTYHLTPRGKRLRLYLQRYHLDIINFLRQRTVVTPVLHQSQQMVYRSDGMLHPVKRPLARPSRSHISTKTTWSTLAYNPTLSQALLRRQADKRHQLTIQAQDFRYHTPRAPQPLSLVLVIDASASMQGMRLHAADALAQDLLNKGDRVAIVVLQERNTRLALPFTTDHQRLQKALNDIAPYGLTPLAAGLKCAEAYLEQSQPTRPWVVLITDGIPTLSIGHNDPLQEAIKASASIGEKGIPFCCIGLEPNKAILRQIVKAGQGALYVVDEIEDAALITALESERKVSQI